MPDKKDARQRGTDGQPGNASTRAPYESQAEPVNPRRINFASRPFDPHWIELLKDHPGMLGAFLPRLNDEALVEWALYMMRHADSPALLEDFWANVQPMLREYGNAYLMRLGKRLHAEMWTYFLGGHS